MFTRNVYSVVLHPPRMSSRRGVLVINRAHISLAPPHLVDHVTARKLPQCIRMGSSLAFGRSPTSSCIEYLSLLLFLLPAVRSCTESVILLLVEHLSLLPCLVPKQRRCVRPKPLVLLPCEHLSLLLFLVPTLRCSTENLPLLLFEVPKRRGCVKCLILLLCGHLNLSAVLS